MVKKFLSSFLRKKSGRTSDAPPLPQRPRLSLPFNDACIYAVGDVHGCFEELIECEAKIEQDRRAHGRPTYVVMLGDYVDRGPMSSSVIEHLCMEPVGDFTRICLAGNHEEAMLKFIANPTQNLDWIDYGGDATLRSYGITDINLFGKMASVEISEIVETYIPQHHIEFLSEFPSLLKVANYVFVHAGIRPKVSLEAQIDRDLLWIREPFLSAAQTNGLLVVHGHTPALAPVVKPGRVCIDTGAYATGRLTVLRILDDEFSFL